ncbi:MAG: AAA family ATPase [Planctomycetes bacterium]|nr:AAA family ATPase [Planctomycetota bacterium]MBL7145821.1 AAA family ATPase [Phycisphaerae bacterium]
MKTFELETIEGQLKSLPELPQKATHPTTPQPSNGYKNADTELIRCRAEGYAKQWPSLAENKGRNNAAHRHAKQLLYNKNVPAHIVWDVLDGWNSRNKPPLDSSELKKAFDSALKSKGQPIDEDFADTKPAAQSKVYNEPPRTQAAADELGQILEDTIDGKRDAVKMPWPMLSKLSMALIVGTLTLFCGSPGASKSFAVLQLAIYLITNEIKTAIFELEEDRSFHLLRALAQLSGLSDLTNPDWVKAEAEEVRQAFAEHKSLIEKVGQTMYAAPDTQLTLEQLADWICKRAKDGCRVIIADPVTACVSTDKPWISDNAFLQAIKRTATEYGCSIVLVTHPTKSTSFPDMNQLAGSAAYARFAQSVLWLEAHDHKDSAIKMSVGTSEESHNRTLHILKARNGRGQGMKLGFEFSAESLTLHEHGTIVKKKNN